MADLQEYDVIVIGAGPTGENVADRAVQGGLTVAIVESELVGGECSYWACMPSKALLRPGQALTEASRVAGSREAATGTLDVEAVLARRDSFASHWSDDRQVAWLESAQVDLVRGRGRLAGERRVDVETSDGSIQLAARKAVVVATGSEAAIPPVPGLADSRPWTTREATSAQKVPMHLIVLGGGVAGCELAQAWASLGSEVTVVEMSDRLLAAAEPFASALVAASMRDGGIELHLGAAASSVSRAEDGQVRVELAGGGAIEGDEVLIAAGRHPRTSDVGLETVGLKPGSWLSVDDSMMVEGVEGRWLYAAGDVNRRALLTHQGKYQGRVCGDAIAARARGAIDTSPWSRYSATADHASVPGVIFTDPEVASVGYTLDRAREAGLRVRAVDYAIGNTAGASLYADGYDGEARIVVDEDRHVIVGATFVGPAVAELLHSATIAVVGEIPLDRLWHAVPSYPTISEVWLRLLEAYGL